MRPQSPRAANTPTRYVGVVYGIVTQNKDDEMPELNRIKVRFPWLDKGDTEQSHWAQLMTPMEGKEFGWYILPDVDDVVLCCFMVGDLNHPIVMGGIWSKEDKPPEPNEDGKNNFRGYRSRSGARMILDDTKKTKVVFSDMTTDLMVGIGHFEEDGEGPNKCAVFKPGRAGKEGISISSMKGNIELTCKKGKLTVDAKENIYVDVKEQGQMNAGKGFSTEGKTTKWTAGQTAKYVGNTTYIGP